MITNLSKNIQILYLLYWKVNSHTWFKTDHYWIGKKRMRGTYGILKKSYIRTCSNHIVTLEKIKWVYLHCSKVFTKPINIELGRKEGSNMLYSKKVA